VRRFFTGLAFLVVFSGCTGARDSAPPKIQFGREACSECHMIIDDDRFCGALFGEDGVYSKFDDIGCMKRFEDDHRWATRPGWVRDFVSRGWLKREEAYYVQTKNILSPMGSGIAAFKERRAAADFAVKTNAAVLSWESTEGGKNETVH